MIAADTSSLSNFLKKAGTADAELVKKALINENLVLSPVVVAELFSSSKMNDEIIAAIEDIPVLELKPGFWKRAGENRAKLNVLGKKARLADSLIATCCLDHRIALIANDNDYRHFAEYFGLVIKPN